MVRGEEHSVVVLMLNKPSSAGAGVGEEGEAEEVSEATSFEGSGHLNLLP